MIKKIKTLLFAIMAISLLAWGVYYYQEKNKPSITVCSGPDQCKTIYGATADDLQNQLGSPADHHRELSQPKIETEEDFMKGYFDEKTFYYKHRNKVFYFINAKVRTGFFEDTGELPDSHAKTFKIIDANFSKDKHQVYARPNMDTRIAYQVIEGANPETFTPLDFPYAKDNNQVYYLNHPIAGAEAASFRIMENKKCGQDKNNFYIEGQAGNEEQCK